MNNLIILMRHKHHFHHCDYSTQQRLQQSHEDRPFQKKHYCQYIVQRQESSLRLLTLESKLRWRVQFSKEGIDKQNNNTNRMASSRTVINNQFINQLFQHPTFITNLHRSIIFERAQRTEGNNAKLSAIIQDLTTDLVAEVTSFADRTYQKMKDEIKSIRMQVDKIKEVHLSQSSTKTDIFAKQISEDINFEDEQLFDLPSVKRTINSLQEKMKEISLNSSTIFDTSELLRESKFKEDFIQERINSEITKIQESFAHQHDNFEEIINKKIEKQQKTINNILQTLNELHSVPKNEKHDKNTSLLTSSKSAVKLKSFFGFG